MRPAGPALPAGRAPTVSVIMANYNGANYLMEAIESVRRQTLADLEIIVSDDASTDGSVAIVDDLMKEDSRISLITSERNAGPAAARNKAVAAARGEWLAIMDSDDLMHPARLSFLIDAARNDHADIIADDLLEFALDVTKPSRRRLSGRWARTAFWVDIVDYVRLNHFNGSGPALGYLKPIFRASIMKGPAGRYDETLKIAEDYNLVLSLLRSGRSMRVHPIPYYYYRRHGTSISHRLSESAFAPLKKVDLRFLEQISAKERRLADAVRARIRSIDTALAYEKLLLALKRRDWLGALAISLTRPQAAMLLRLPLGVRLRRMLPSWGNKAFITLRPLPGLQTSPGDDRPTRPPNHARLR
jgi:glycosyltransferase involved in cell wall biosynthesis